MTNSQELLFKLSKDLFVIATGDYSLELNPAWTDTLGWTEKDLLSRPFFDFVHPEDRAMTEKENIHAINGASRSRFENRYRTETGEYRWLQRNSSVPPRLF